MTFVNSVAFIAIHFRNNVLEHEFSYHFLSHVILSVQVLIFMVDSMLEIFWTFCIFILFSNDIDRDSGWTWSQKCSKRKVWLMDRKWGDCLLENWRQKWTVYFGSLMHYMEPFYFRSKAITGLTPPPPKHILELETAPRSLNCIHVVGSLHQNIH